MINSIRNLFASPEKLLELKTREMAMQTTKDIDNLQKIIKDGEYAMADHQKVVDDRERFLRDNTETQIDQNVTRNSDNKRAYMLLTGVMLIGCILSVKGLKFFFGEFYASISLLMIIPIAMILAGVIVVGSIYLNNFSNRFRGQNPFVFYQLKVAAYAMVLFIPAMNLLEGFDSNYRPVVMTLNIVGSVIDVVLHTSLVSMSSVFTTAEDSKKAIKIMRLKDKDLAASDQKLRAFNDTFIKAKAASTSSAKQLVSSFKELQIINPQAAANALLLLDNFTIWMINNRVMQHTLLPYHANENGQIQIDPSPFTSEQNSMIQGWDTFSSVKVDNASNQQAETLNGQRQAIELPAANEAAQQHQEQDLLDDTRVHEPGNEEPESQPADYDAMLDNVNPNDKIL